MAQLFVDSFDHYSTAALAVEKWGLGTTTGLTVGAYGRNSTQGLRIDAGGISQTTGYLQFAVANLATSIIGFALKGTGADRPLVRFMDNTSQQCAVYLRSDGRLEARDGANAVIGTGTAIISSSIHKYVECKATIHATTGTVVVKVDGVTDIDTGANDDTQNTANAYATAIRLGYGLGSAETSAYVYDVDDVYIYDTTGGAQDDFAGDVRVEWCAVTGAGGSTQFTPSTGSNYQNVDDTSPDDDTTYNASSTVGHLDRFALANLVTTAGSVLSVTSIVRARKDNSGARTLHNHLYLSTAGTPTQESGDLSPATAYGWFRSLHRLDGDAAAWSVTKVNALEVGYEVQA